jgi:hypothetical protein
MQTDSPQSLKGIRYSGFSGVLYRKHNKESVSPQLCHLTGFLLVILGPYVVPRETAEHASTLGCLGDPEVRPTREPDEEERGKAEATNCLERHVTTAFPRRPLCTHWDHYLAGGTLPP